MKGQFLFAITREETEKRLTEKVTLVRLHQTFKNVNIQNSLFHLL